MAILKQIDITDLDTNTTSSNPLGAEAENIDISRDSSGDITDVAHQNTSESLNTTLGNIEDKLEGVQHNFIGTLAEWNALTDAEKAEYDTYDMIDEFNNLPIDDALSNTSTNPVQNKVIKSALDEKLGTDDISAWAKASTKPTYTASEVGLGNVGNFKAVSTEANQQLTDTEKSNARANIGAGTGSSNFSGNYTDLSNKPTLGTAAAKDIATSGNASSTQVVMGNDSRLSDSRTPTSHASTSTTYGIGDTNNYGHVKVDSSLSTTSTNPVQNKVIKSALDGKLDKLDYEYNKTINFGQSGFLKIGSFPMYDSGIVIDIDATTSQTYHGTVVIATQNVSTTSMGSAHVVSVYGDPTGAITNALRVTWASGSRNYNVFFVPQSWSKNFIHIRATALDSAPTDICISQSGTVPTTTSGLEPNNIDAKAFRTDDAAETTLADGDYFPFYDTSASAKKKILWSNIVNKTKAALGTAAAKDIATSGNASSTQVVMGNDSRLSDSRTPTSHASTSTTYGIGDTNNYGHVKVDSSLSTTSTNPVQNKVIKSALDAVYTYVDTTIAQVFNGSY